MAVATQTLGLAEIRPAAGEALAPLVDTDPAVFVDVVEAVEPPAILLLWDDPWLEPGVDGRAVMGPCLWTARLVVLCIAGRLEPGAGIATLETLVAHVVDRLRDDDAYTWPPATVLAPRIFDIGAVPYLGARVAYNVPTSI